MMLDVRCKHILEKFRKGQITAFECIHLIQEHGDEMVAHLLSNGFITRYTEGE